MTKYGRRLRFGYAINAAATDPARPLRLATLAEILGLEYVSIQQPPLNGVHYDIWTLLAAIAVTTSRVSIFANVGDLLGQSPVSFAHAAASLDLLTSGRLEVALGAEPFLAQPRDSQGDKHNEQAALAVLEEALQIARLMWSDEKERHFDGDYYQLGKLPVTLLPARRIGIWLGGKEPQTLAFAGRLADGWLADAYPTIQGSDLATLSQLIDEAATAAEREPAKIQRIWPITGTISDDESDLPFRGTPKQWAATLAQLATEVGIDTFLLMEAEMSTLEEAEAQLERFAHEVEPLTREMVELSPGATVVDGLSRAYQGSVASGATPAEDATDDVDWVDETSMESFPASDPPSSSSFT